MSKIKESLVSLFEQNRIILWYDEDQSFTQEFDTLELEGIEKICINKLNTFTISPNDPKDKNILQNLSQQKL